LRERALFKKIRLVVALASAAVAALAGSVAADPDSKVVSAHSESQRATGPDCPSPVGLCTKGHIQGTIKGDFESLATQIIPSDVPGVLYIRATTTMHINGGDLYVEEHAIVNSSPNSFGEFMSLGEITGGTGEWFGAHGYLQATGASGEGDNVADISGRIATP
jgi:hypothetical protein